MSVSALAAALVWPGYGSLADLLVASPTPRKSNTASALFGECYTDPPEANTATEPSTRRTMLTNHAVPVVLDRSFCPSTRLWRPFSARIAQPLAATTHPVTFGAPSSSPSAVRHGQLLRADVLHLHLPYFGSVVPSTYCTPSSKPESSTTFLSSWCSCSHSVSEIHRPSSPTARFPCHPSRTGRSSNSTT